MEQDETKAGTGSYDAGWNKSRERVVWSRMKQRQGQGRMVKDETKAGTGSYDAGWNKSRERVVWSRMKQRQGQLV
jgi:hypothetical protein